MNNKIILPKSYYEAERTPDPDFVRRMEAVDRKLLVYWNRFRMCWVIDRYTCETDHKHNTECPRVNVRIVQGDDGEYHPLNDSVLDWLRKADMWNRGITPESANAELDAKKAAWEASRDNDLRMYSRDLIHDEHIHSESNIGASK